MREREVSSLVDQFWLVFDVMKGKEESARMEKFCLHWYGLHLPHGATAVAMMAGHQMQELKAKLVTVRISRFRRFRQKRRKAATQSAL